MRNSEAGFRGKVSNNFNPCTICTSYVHGLYFVIDYKLLQSDRDLRYGHRAQSPMLWLYLNSSQSYLNPGLISPETQVIPVKSLLPLPR